MLNKINLESESKEANRTTTTRFIQTGETRYT